MSDRSYTRCCVFLSVLALVVFSAPVQAQDDEPSIPKGTLIDVTDAVPTLRQVVSENAPVRVQESFEQAAQRGWTTEGPWTYGAAPARMGTPSSGMIAGTALGGSYPAGTDARLISPPIRLAPGSRSILTFREAFEIESGYDQGLVEVSTDGGQTWRPVDQRSGMSLWRDYRIDLTPFAGEEVLIAFRLMSDESEQYGGWLVDDVKVETGMRLMLDASITSLNSQVFPFLFMNVAVNDGGEPVGDLTADDFAVYEDEVLQTDFFRVEPPESGDGVRRADIVFLMDNSGSMGGEINAVRNNVFSFVDALDASGVNYNLGLTRFGQSGGSNPLVEENGQLTGDADYFKNTIWQRNFASGGYEPSHLAITQSASTFNFRPGAQRIFILITDENSDGSTTQQQALNALTSSSTTLYVLTTSGLFNYYGPLASGTNGQLYNIFSPFNDILDSISEDVGGSYVVRYKSSNPALDGVERLVRVEVNTGGATASDVRTYTPGAAPSIVRTAETIALGPPEAWLAGTPFTIEADITDSSAPGVQSATLYYRTTGETGASSYSSVPMSLVGGTRYSGTIPGSAVEEPGVDYYITATDGETTSSSPSLQAADNPHQISILPNQPPFLAHAPVTSVVAGADIRIQATASDGTNELQDVRLFYRRIGVLDPTEIVMQPVIGDLFSATIPGGDVTADGVEYHIVARDDLGISTYKPAGTGENWYPIEVVEPGLTVIIHGYRGVVETDDDGLGVDQTWTLTMARAIAKRTENAVVYTVDLNDEHDFPWFDQAGVPLEDYDASGESYGGTFYDRLDPHYVLGDGDHKILVLDWLEESEGGLSEDTDLGNNPAGGAFAEAVADAALALILEGASDRFSAYDRWSLSNVHVIGHSRGAVVGSEIVQRLGLYSGDGWSLNQSLIPTTPIEIGTVHFTALDPHPADDNPCDGVGDVGVDLYDHNVNSKIISFADLGNPECDETGSTTWGVVCWRNTDYCDNYWHERGLFDLFDLSGMPYVPGSGLSLDLTDTDDVDPGIDHGGVHAWYHGTIELDDVPGNGSPATDDVDGLLDLSSNQGGTEEIEFFSSWYPNTQLFDRGRVGFNWSLFGAGDISNVQTNNLLSIPVDRDTRFRPGQIFNGDFAKAVRKLEASDIYRDVVPGWEFQGGENGQENRTINRLSRSRTPGYHMRLRAGESQAHNWLYVPSVCEGECTLWVDGAYGRDIISGADGFPVMVSIDQWGDEAEWQTLGSISPLAFPAPDRFGQLNRRWAGFSLAEYAGSAVRIRLSADENGDSGVYFALNEVTFEDPGDDEYVVMYLRYNNALATRTSGRSSVKRGAANADGEGTPLLRVTSSEGVITGVLGDRPDDWEENIPGSQYILIGQASESPIQSVRVPEGEPYTVEVISNGYEGEVSLSFEDPYREGRTAIAVFAGVSLTPTTVLQLVAATPTQDLELLVDQEGDGEFESTLAPTEYVDGEGGSEDTTAPECGPIALEFNNGSYEIVSSATDNVGITSATITRLTSNLDAYINGDGPFAEGDVVTLPEAPTNVDLLARVTELSGRITFLVTVADAAGNESVCDPVITDLDGALPQETALGSAYPNPTHLGRGSVTVPFTVAEPTAVRIAVYDVLGREVAVLADEEFEAGSYEVEWAESRALPAGLYLIRFHAGTQRETQRITLVR